MKNVLLSLSVVASIGLTGCSTLEPTQVGAVEKQALQVEGSDKSVSCDPVRKLSVEEFSKKLAEKYPRTQFTSISESNIPGIFEVFMGKNVAYVETSARYFIFGHTFDMDTQRDITQSRLDEKTKVEWNSLPLSASFAVKKGNGSRHVAVFTDPECPYCTKLEKEFAQMTDVTIHYFLMPLDMHPNAKPKADAIWCSTNKAKALSDVMDGQNVQNPKKGCVAPTADVLAFASQHGISGTPALIRHDGKLMPGFAPAAKLSEWLDGK